MTFETLSTPLALLACRRVQVTAWSPVVDTTWALGGLGWVVYADDEARPVPAEMRLRFSLGTPTEITILYRASR